MFVDQGPCNSWGVYSIGQKLVKVRNTENPEIILDFGNTHDFNTSKGINQKNPTSQKKPYIQGHRPEETRTHVRTIAAR